MNRRYKIIPLFALFIFVFFGSFAQQNHFIYVQTENKQPFYVRLNNKVFSSSASGYLIIPKLQDAAYVLTIGFPKNEWPEQNVTCSINKKDAGYLLKDFGDKGWGLFNLQTMEVLVQGNSIADNKTIVEDNKKEPASANTLPNIAVADSAVVKKPEEKAVVKEEAKPAIEIGKEKTSSNTLPDITNADSAITKKTEEKAVVKEEVKPVIEIAKKENVKPVVKIIKLLSANTTEGAEMVYVDVVDGKSDTVIVFIPAAKDSPIVEREKKLEESKIEEQKIETKKIVPKDTVIVQPEKKLEEPKIEEQKIETKKPTPKVTDTKFIDITLPNPNERPDSATKQLVVVPEVIAQKKIGPAKIPEKQKEEIAKPVIVNPDCKDLASEDDFLKLRKKMVAEANDDDMVDVARKIFRTKCFTTLQIKNLCVLFLNDEGRYKFFDAAYPFVSDSFNFGSLEALLTDTYFISRFKAMIRH
jgi:hypothetical protein